MTIRTKVAPPITVDDDVNLQSVRLYRADATASPPNHPRVHVVAKNALGIRFEFDHALSEFSTLSGAQKTTLGNLVQALFAETLTLETFT